MKALEYEGKLERHGSKIIGPDGAFSDKEGYRIIESIRDHLKKKGCIKVDHKSTHSDWTVGSGNTIEELYLHQEGATLTLINLTHEEGHEPENEMYGEEGGDVFAGIQIHIKSNNPQKLEEIKSELRNILYPEES
jgi:hypothetical protein